MKFSYLFVLSLFFITSFNFAQKSSKKSQQEFKKGVEVYNKSELEHALSHFKLAIELNDSNFLAFYYAGISEFILKQNMNNCVSYLNTSINLQGKEILYPEAYYYLAYSNLYLNNYDGAQKALEDIKPYLNESKHGVKLTEELLSLEKIITNNRNKKVDNNITLKLLKEVNTPYPEYGLIITKDSNNAFYTSRANNTKEKSFYSDFFQKENVLKIEKFSDLEHNKETRVISPVFNSKNQESVLGTYNEQLVVLSKKKLYIIKDNRLEPLDIKIKNSKNISSIYQSKDRKYLFISFTNKGPVENRDIFFYRIDDQGVFSEPYNISINTLKNEDTPFLDDENDFFYFSSDRNNGLGGYDVYKCSFNNGEFGEPELLPSPINSSGDDVCFFILNNKKEGYLSSYRDDGKGHLDIYHVDLECEYLKEVQIKGHLLTSNLNSISEITLGFIDSIGTFTKINTDGNGEFIFKAPTESYIKLILYRDSLNPHVFDISTQKYCAKDTLYPIINFNAKDSLEIMEMTSLVFNNSPNQEFIALNDILKTKMGKYKLNDNNDLVFDPNGPIIINHQHIKYNQINLNRYKVFFAFDSYSLDEKSKKTLDSLFIDLVNSPDINIVLNGHTDYIGIKKYNLKLSENRAKSVKDYLIKKGIDKNRLKTNAEASNKPLTDSKDWNEIGINRRVDFKIIN